MDYHNLRYYREKEVKTIAKYCGQILGLKKDYSVTYNPYGKIWYIHLIGYGDEYERVTIFEHELYDKSYRELIEIICHEVIHSRILRINP